MVPVPLAALLPPELELELELPPQAASANNAVTAAAAVRYLARERADKGRAGYPEAGPRPAGRCACPWLHEGGVKRGGGVSC